MRLYYGLVVFGLILAGQLGAFGQTTAQKIAFIDRAKFADEATGIRRLVSAFAALEQYVKPDRTNLDNLRKAHWDATSVVSGSRAANDPKVLAAKAELAARLERDIEFKQKDFDERYKVIREMHIGPVYQDIRRFLGTWARQQGIDAIIDVNKAGDSVLVINNAADVTAAFVNAYNEANKIK